MACHFKRLGGPRRGRRVKAARPRGRPRCAGGPRVFWGGPRGRAPRVPPTL